MSMYLSGGNSHDRRKAGRARIHAANKAIDRIQAATYAIWTPIGLAIGAPADAETIMRAEGVFLKIKAEPKHTPRCKGTNCDAAPGDDHSAECVAEHAAACAPIRDSVQDEAANLRDFQFIEGGSVRNTRTKSVATMQAKTALGANIMVKRRDNRIVEWPVSECENWNL